MRQDQSVLAGSAGATSGSLTPDFDAYEQVNFAGLTGSITINAPTSVAQDGRKRLMRFKDTGTARTITWNSIYRAVGVTLPATTSAGKTLYVGVVRNNADAKWDVIAVGLEA